MKRVLNSRFWARFQAVITTAPDLLSILIQHLTREEKEALRGVDKATKEAMNAIVTTVCWRGNWRGADGLAADKQLHSVFPNVTSLRGGHAVDPQLAVGYLQLLASSNVSLLNNLHHLGIEVPSSMIVETTTDVIWRILNRYEPQQVASITMIWHSQLAACSPAHMGWRVHH
jgi:hypothetical protein